MLSMNNNHFDHNEKGPAHSRPLLTFGVIWIHRGTKAGSSCQGTCKNPFFQCLLHNSILPIFCLSQLIFFPAIMHLLYFFQVFFIFSEYSTPFLTTSLIFSSNFSSLYRSRFVSPVSSAVLLLDSFSDPFFISFAQDSRRRRMSPVWSFAFFSVASPSIKYFISFLSL